jgi:hypothetical protein
VYDPLYNHRIGGLCGFVCGTCGRVTRTQRGMLAHCRIVHKLFPQLELYSDKLKAEPPADAPVHTAGDRPAAKSTSEVSTYHRDEA